jgi:hypothetical protein
MHKVTIQELFDAAYLGLKSQGFDRASSKSGGPALDDYRSNHRHCALGWVYKVYPQLDFRAQASQWAAWLGDFGDFSKDLRRAHDWARGPEDMRLRLVEVAAQYSLTVPDDPNSPTALLNS